MDNCSSFASATATIFEDKDKKGRPRIRILPARNNAHVAPMPKRYLSLNSINWTIFDNLLAVH
jgi:hypothetical protein